MEVNEGFFSLIHQAVQHPYFTWNSNYSDRIGMNDGSFLLRVKIRYHLQNDEPELAVLTILDLLKLGNLQQESAFDFFTCYEGVECSLEGVYLIEELYQQKSLKTDELQLFLDALPSPEQLSNGFELALRGTLSNTLIEMDSHLNVKVVRGSSMKTHWLEKFEVVEAYVFHPNRTLFVISEEFRQLHSYRSAPWEETLLSLDPLQDTPPGSGWFGFI